MNAREFLSTSRQLKASGAEADLRSSASRAYYAAFHLAGERLEQLTNFRWTAVPKKHRDLMTKWEEHFPNDGASIKNFLYNAKVRREKADYDLHLPYTDFDLRECRDWVAEVIRAVRKNSFQ